MVSTTLWLVDDNEAFRTSTSWILEDNGVTVTEFPAAKDLLEEIDELPDTVPDCIITDMRMPDMNGLELMDALRRKKVDIPVILITGHGDIPLAVEAMRHGAASVLEKPFDCDVLLATIEAAVTEPGARLRNPSEARAKLDKLTPRERQVMDLVCRGQLSKTIADKLGISIKTVELHRSNLTNKLGIKSVQDLVRLNLGYE